MLWFLEDSSDLSENAKRILTNGENELFWSSVSYWEITVKISLNKLVLATGWQDLLDREKKENRIQDLPLYQNHCKPNLMLPWHHRDPFDRLLICQAMIEGLAFLTKDKNIRKYDVQSAW